MFETQDIKTNRDKEAKIKKDAEDIWTRVAQKVAGELDIVSDGKAPLITHSFWQTRLRTLNVPSLRILEYVATRE